MNETRQKMNVELSSKMYSLFFDEKGNYRYVRYKGARGGRAGSKSFGYADMAISRVLQGARLVVCRELKDSIKDSVHRLLKDRVFYHSLNDRFEITDSEITCLAGGGSITYKHLHNNVTEIKGLEGADICWIFEAENLTRESFDILDPTIRRPKAEIWFEYNTALESDFVYDFTVIHPPKNMISILVNYLDNPWCPKNIIELAERCKEDDEALYRHIWLGEPSSVGRFFNTFGKHMRIKPYKLEPGAILYGSLDHGITAPTSFGLWYKDSEKKPIRIMTYYQSGKSASENAYAIAEAIHAFPFTDGQPPIYVFADGSMWTKERLSKDYQPSAIEFYEAAFRDVFRLFDGYKTVFIKGSKDRKNTCVVVKEYFSSPNGVPNSYYFDHYNKAYEDLIPKQRHDKYNMEVYDTNLEDHIADDTCYGLSGMRGYANSPMNYNENKYDGDVIQNILDDMVTSGMVGVTGI